MYLIKIQRIRAHPSTLCTANEPYIPCPEKNRGREVRCTLQAYCPKSPPRPGSCVTSAFPPLGIVCDPYALTKCIALNNPLNPSTASPLPEACVPTTYIHVPGRIFFIGIFFSCPPGLMFKIVKTNVKILYHGHVKY